MSVFSAGSILPFLLDVIPPAALVLLAVHFLFFRKRCRTEERRLRSAISAFQAEDAQVPEPPSEEEEKS